MQRFAEPAQPTEAVPQCTAVAVALRRLHARPEAAPSVQALAQACGMSAPRFIRCFKAATGVTPGVYRLNLRLNGARRDLRRPARSERSVAQIAVHWGFTHFGQFSQDYRQLFDELPSETLRAAGRSH